MDLIANDNLQLLKKNKKKNSIRNKINKNDIQIIINLYNNGTSMTEIAKKYNLKSITTISNIINQKSWK